MIENQRSIMVSAVSKVRIPIFSDLFFRIHLNNIRTDEVATIVLLKIELSAFQRENRIFIKAGAILNLVLTAQNLTIPTHFTSI